MTKLREISDQFKEIALLAEDDGMAEAVADTLEAIEGEFNDKAQALTSVLLNMDGDVDALDKEIKRLTARKTVIKNTQQRMKEYLRINMERCDIKRISCPLFTITCAQGREVVCIDNQDLIHNDYLNVKTSITPDKAAITKALKDGIVIPGAHLERSASSIRIK